MKICEVFDQTMFLTKVGKVPSKLYQVTDQNRLCPWIQSFFGFKDTCFNDSNALLATIELLGRQVYEPFMGDLNIKDVTSE